MNDTVASVRGRTPMSWREGLKKRSEEMDIFEAERKTA